MPYLMKIRGGVDVDSMGKKAGKGPLIQEDISATLGVSQDQYLFQPISVENHPHDSRVQIDKSGTVQTLAGMSGNNQPVICVCGIDLYNCAVTKESTKTLNAGSDADHVPCVCIAGNVVDRDVKQHGDGFAYDTAYTLNTVDKHAVVYPQKTQEAMNDMYVVEQMYWDGTQIAGTLTANNAGGSQRMPDKDNFNCVIMETFHCTTDMRKSPAIKARDYKDPHVIAIDRAAFNQGENAKYDFSVDGGGTAQTIVARGPGAVCYKLPESADGQEGVLYIAGETKRRTQS